MNSEIFSSRISRTHIGYSVAFFRKHIKNAPQKGVKKLKQFIAEKELLDLRQALMFPKDRRDAAITASEICRAHNTAMQQLSAWDEPQAQQNANEWKCRELIRRPLQRAMTPKQFASWIGCDDLIMSLIGPCRDLWARNDLLIRGFARIHCRADSSASRDVINIIQRNFVEYPDAKTATCAGDILVFLAGQDELKRAHVERLWSAIVAPMQHSERRSDTELSSWKFEFRALTMNEPPTGTKQRVHSRQQRCMR